MFNMINIHNIVLPTSRIVVPSFLSWGGRELRLHILLRLLYLYGGFGIWYLTPLSTIFQLYRYIYMSKCRSRHKHIKLTCSPHDKAKTKCCVVIIQQPLTHLLTNTVR